MGTCVYLIVPRSRVQSQWWESPFLANLDVLWSSAQLCGARYCHRPQDWLGSAACHSPCLHQASLKSCAALSSSLGKPVLSPGTQGHIHTTGWEDHPCLESLSVLGHCLEEGSKFQQHPLSGYTLSLLYPELAQPGWLPGSSSAVE